MNWKKPSGVRSRVAAAIALILLVCASAMPTLGEGKVFPSTAFPADVKIPDQSALIIWSNGVERLVIETRFVGEGTNFAWVVPLPAVPEIEPATTGLFPTLRVCLQPSVLHRVPKFWALALFGCGLIWLIGTVRKGNDPTMLDLVGCLAAAIGFSAMVSSGPGLLFGSLVAFLIALLCVNRVRAGRESILTILVVFLLLAILASMMLPALGTAGRGGTATTEPGVNILERKVVGVFDTTVISAKDSKALLHWLSENGFAADKHSEPVIEQHIRDGWVFVATKVHRDSVNPGAVTPHPLSFTFKAAEPIYPLRLTATGSERLALELFIVGPKRAEIPNFKVAECQQLQTISGARPDAPKPMATISHDLFAKWAGDLPVITKLTAELSPADMARDAIISWSQFRGRHTQLYSEAGALITAANWSISPICILAMIVGLVAHRNGGLSHKSFWVSAGAAGCVLLAGVMVFIALPKTQVRFERFAPQRSHVYLTALALTAEDQVPTNQPVTIQLVRAALAKTKDQWRENLLQGGVVREEDSPGNYTLRETLTGVAVVGYNALGAAQELHTIPRFPAPTNSPAH